MRVREYPEKNKVDMLNVLRFTAFMMIFLLHAKTFIPVKWNENSSIAWILYTPAWAGTWIFFMLSGYGIGAGFYLGKYDLSINGILHYYIKRIFSILPIYWFWIIAVSFFIKPEILIPSKEHMVFLLKLFFFDYQEEFFSAEYGLGWYMTTLIRLYLVAPFGYLLLQKLVKSKRSIYLVLTTILLVGVWGRCMMGYHISTSGEGDWSSNVYKPFYYNFDIFFSGMLLNYLKDYKKRESRGRYMRKHIIVLLLYVFIAINSNIYYNFVYGKSNYMNLYCYIFPSIYIILIAIYIFYFDIQKKFQPTKLTFLQLKNNYMRIFDYFQKIQFPAYLFHSSVLLCISTVYEEESYVKICNWLLISEDKYNFAAGCVYTLICFIICIIWAIVIHEIFKGMRKGRVRVYLEEINYGYLKDKVINVLQVIFPL